MKKTTGSEAVGAAWRTGFKRHAIAAALAAAFGTVAGPAWAQLPSGATVVNGTAGIATSGNRMTVTNSANAVLNWQAFNIGPQNSVRFEQPGTSSKVLNRVTGNDPSNILGSLSSNGSVWLINPHGVLFGSNARIDVGGMVASSLAISNDDFLAGRFRFEGATLPSGQVLNRGEINTSFGGHVWLVGGSVRNEGLVRSPGGQIVLAAGSSIDMVDSGMPNVAVRVSAPNNEALNLGTLLAPGGGSIDVHGGIVNQQGIVRADSAGTDAAGRVVIRASGDVQLGAASETSASAAGSGKAGKVSIESLDGAALVQGRASAASAGGAGGQIHLLGKHVGVYGNAVVDASGATGGGEVLAGGDYQGKNPLIRNAAATYFGPHATVLANATGTGNGGKVIFWGDEATRVYGTIAARGGQYGGDGGFVETSGHVLDVRTNRISVAAARGKAGTWLLDPGDIHINDGSSQGLDTNDSMGLDFTSNTNDATVNASDIATTLAYGSNVSIKTGGGAQTTQMGNIYVEKDIVVPASETASGTLSLQAHNDIVMNAGTKIVAGSGPLSVNFLADLDHDGIGNIQLRDGASILTKGGDINLTAPSDGLAPKGTILMNPNSSLGAGSGRVNVKAGTVAMSYGSSINAAHIVLEGGGVSLVSASLNASDPDGSSINIDAGGVKLNGSTVSATSGPSNAAGASIAIDAGGVEMTGGTLAARDISVSAGGATLDNAVIRATGSHDSSVKFDAGGVTMSGGEIQASVTNPGSGTGSLLSVEVGGLTVSDNARLGAGQIAVSAGGVTVTDSTLATAVEPHSSVSIDTGGLTLTRTTVNAKASGDGVTDGAIKIDAGGFTMLGSNLISSGQTGISAGGLTITSDQGPSGISAAGITIDAGGVTLDHASLASSIGGDAIRIAAGGLTNTGSRLTTPNGRWLVYLGPGNTAFPAADLGDLDYKFVQVNATASTPTAVTGIGQNGILMADPLAVKIKVDAARPYDGTVKATFNHPLSSNAPAGFQVQTIYIDDILDGTFADKNAGVDKPIIYTGGGDAFRIVTTTGVRVYGAEQSYIGDITRKALTASGIVADNKVYDGNRFATLHGTLSGVIAGDNVSLGGATGLFDTRDVGTGKTVTISGSSLSGADAGNYTVAANTTTTANITPKQLSVSGSGITADNKVYDGNRIATLHGTLLGIIAGDQVSLGSASGMFDTKNVGTGKTVTISGGSLSGADAGNYTLGSFTATTTADITPKPLSASNIIADNKVYDGNRNATVSGSLSGIIAGDNVTLAGATGLFDTRNVGTGKTVTISGGSLSGADAGNYSLAGGSGTTTADIVPKALTVPDARADNKVYDGNRIATLHGTLSGVIAGDNVSLGGATGLFDTKDVGTGKTVTISGGSLSGADAGNYTVATTTTTTADITPRPLSLSGPGSGFVADNKVYDGNRFATVHGTLSGVIAGDNVSLGATSGMFDTKDVGTGKTVTISGGSLSGADAGNYTLAGITATTTADITPKPLSASNIVADNKVYDGNRNATVSGSLSGIIAGDSVRLTGATGLFDTKDVGTGKTVTISGASLSGADAGNYSLTGGGGTTTADITARPLATDGIVAASKTYDGKRDTTLSGSLTGIIAGDDVRLGNATGLFDTKNVGTGKTVTISGPLSGADAGNYSLTGGAPILADITAKPITTAGITAASKTYDGKRDAALSGSLNGIIAGDEVTLAGATGQFDTKNVGNDKTVTVSGASLSGADAGNYRLTDGPAITANITPKLVTIGVDGQITKEYDATTSTSLGGAQFTMVGMVANDAVTVRGPAQGSYDTPDVGERKLVNANGQFEISGADAGNYRVGSTNLTSGVNLVNLGVSGTIGSITPAMLTYTATPAVREPGLPVTGLDGTVTGFKGSDSLASATSGTLQWQSNTVLQSPPGSYAINGAGLVAKNYNFIQAPGNATALLVKPNESPSTPQAQAQQSSTVATNTATQSAIPPLGLQDSIGGLLDASGPAPTRTFGTIRIGSMNQDQLAQMLADRRVFKKKLFANAIYKLELDPNLADVRPCPTVADAVLGTCRLTASQLELMHAAKPQAVAAKAIHAKAASLPQIQRKVIVLFGINDYADKTIPPLENSLPDVDAVAKIFTDKLGYEARISRNPTKADIIRILNGLATEMNSEDSVVIYYAGHGYSLEKNGAGYWVPSDAKASDPHGWISNNDVAKLLSSVSAKQMALISDSCYSGAFAREGLDEVGQGVTAADVLNKRSVVVLSSGGDEPVADEGKDGHSIFAWNLMQVVGTVTDWKPGSTVFTTVQSGVRKEFPQTPKYGAVTAAGHQRGGDYLFEFR